MTLIHHRLRIEAIGDDDLHVRNFIVPLQAETFQRGERVIT